jgi:hypothetical protein
MLHATREQYSARAYSNTQMYLIKDVCGRNMLREHRKQVNVM